MHFGTHTDLSDCVAYCIFPSLWEVFGIVNIFFKKIIILFNSSNGVSNSRAFQCSVMELFSFMYTLSQYICVHYCGFLKNVLTLPIQQI